MTTSPASADFIDINDHVRLPASDVRFEFTRSGGPGGQNVNKVNTRVTLRFDIGSCAALTARQKQRLRRKLATRVTRGDVLFVVSSRHRTQKANRRAATRRFAELVAGALRREKRRKKTVVPRSAKKRRLDEKRRRGSLKRFRAGPVDD
jgi:ribosome-associated protein